MTIVTTGVVLSRRPFGEFDAAVQLFTEALGRVPARFKGVQRPKGKLKALAEPMAHAEYRLYVKTGSEWVTVTGGRLIQTFPRVRADFDRTCRGLRMCELLNRLTPPRNPAPRKLDLLVEHLETLETADGAWLPVSFGLRLLDLAGFGISERRVADGDRRLWTHLHEAPAEALGALPDEPAARERIERMVEHTLEEQLDRPLATTLFQELLERARARRDALVLGGAA